MSDPLPPYPPSYYTIIAISFIIINSLSTTASIIIDASNDSVVFEYNHCYKKVRILSLNSLFAAPAIYCC